MQKFTAMLYGVALSALTVGGVVFGISYWLESRFGASSVLVVWGGLGLCIAMFVGILIAGMVQRWTLNGIVDFQAADDRGEVARFGAIKEVLRGQREFERDVRRAALPLAKNQAYVINERQRLEDTRHRIETTAADDWYALPDHAGVEVSDDDGEWV